MPDRAFVFTLIALLLMSSQFVYGQQTGERNLQICSTGKYPALCNHSELTRDQVTAVREAERAENLRVCSTGKYPALCSHSELTRDQVTAVREAERAENLRVCSTGKYPALCNHSELTRDQVMAVREAERAENLRVCSTGKYPALCNHSELTRDQVTAVREAERAENLRVCSTGKYPALCQRSLLTPEQVKQVTAAEVGATADRLSEAPNARPTCYESSIMSPTPFMGNDGEVLRLADGSLWEVKYEYEYMYEYYPSVIICPSKGTLVVGGETLSVQLITAAPGAIPTTVRNRPGVAASAVATADVVESRIDGEFSGWEGDTIFKLQNGQLWQQSSYAYKYRYSYRPKVLIYKSGSIYKMRVDGVDGEIAVRRLK